MRTENQIQSLTDALYSAIYKDMNDIVYKDRDFSQRKVGIPLSELPTVEKKRRPRMDEIEVYGMFLQTWGSTALGFGGMGGSAISAAYTIVLRCNYSEFAVYFGGRLAYKITNPSELFYEDVRMNNMKSVTEASKYHND